MTNPKPIADRVTDVEQRMNALETTLKSNTEMTFDIYEIVKLGKTFFKALSHIGNFIKWLAGIGAAIGVLYALWTHGPGK